MRSREALRVCAAAFTIVVALTHCGQVACAESAAEAFDALLAETKARGERLAVVRDIAAAHERSAWLAAPKRTQVGRFQLVSAENAWLSVLLNARDTSRTARALRLAQGVDAVLVAPPGGTWRLFLTRGDELIEAAKAPGERDAAGWESWLRRTFGFDGVVLAQRGAFLLANGAPERLARTGLQAVAYKTGERPFLTEADRRVGTAAIVELVTSRGTFALFRSIAGAPPAVGDKLVFE